MKYTCIASCTEKVIFEVNIYKALFWKSEKYYWYVYWYICYTFFATFLSAWLLKLVIKESDKQFKAKHCTDKLIYKTKCIWKSKPATDSNNKLINIKIIHIIWHTNYVCQSFKNT